MGCCDSKNSMLERPSTRSTLPTHRLQIWGDFHSTDTRVILSILEYCQITYEFELVDILKDQQNKSKFRKLSPDGKIPLIKDNTFIIYPGLKSQIFYLANAYDEIKSKLYFEEESGQTYMTEQFLVWYQSEMKPVTSIIEQALLKSFLNKDIYLKQMKAIQDQINIFDQRILSHLEELFEIMKINSSIEQQYICGNKLTLPDILAYQEIFSVLKLSQKSLDQQRYPKVYEWFHNTMAKSLEIQKVNQKFYWVKQV
ncbi:glutathione s-n-terminal domain protein [Stylonychia lemnae]|uniref:Glutathione s-n-terminal domain protein n=1 Tax=Stylonychia lemnae TaxID=5949 RepID=A0A078B130_STYLE|nr:glutathione s-n-terminal domain protein [Stylonychia lemnae]|eukprot:CDW86803.1 glutathione s-n-terminal domain protein [Stylonychia lemnae]